MHVINCHQNTEAADLLGGLRPLRGRDRLVTEFRKRAQQFLCLVGAASAYSFEVEETPEEVEADWLSLAHMDVSDTMAKVQVTDKRYPHIPVYSCCLRARCPILLEVD